MDAHDFVSEKFDKIVRNSIDSVESSQPLAISQQSQCKEMPMKSAGKSCGEPKRRRKKPKALCTNWLTKR